MDENNPVMDENNEQLQGQESEWQPEQQQPEGQDEQEEQGEQDGSQVGEQALLDDEQESPQSVPYSRFNEVYYQKKQAEKELQALREEQAKQAPPPQANDPTKPKLEQFDYDEEKFNDALLDWKLEQRDQQARIQQQQQEQQQKYGDFRKKQERYIDKNPNYQQLAMQADAAGVQFNDNLADMILNSEAGVQIHHHLLANPDKLERLNVQSPLQAMREVVRLEQSFTKAKPKPVSRTPDPIKPGGHGGATTTKPTNERLAKMTPDEYYQYRMSQKK